ncbi:transporter family-2 protein [Deinobacterium chartae]|uniref:Transporter family-2 protein n=1 Tax=Deinobacterium chartae TaxID=521158 RepID=A0A841I1X6_9DEIO|nr:DMT family transporter [Deinobacterium chartae]MBB6099263.1 transporter family-2 protein [Deinobacterium chartae]
MRRSPILLSRFSLLLVPLAAGALLPVQFALNTRLSTVSESVSFSAAVSYAVGTLVLLLLMFSGRFGRLRPDELRRAPRWAWLGGVLGCAYVVSSMILTARLGTALASSVVIAAQTLTVLTIDHFGAFGLDRRPITLPRALAGAALIAAVALQSL